MATHLPVYQEASSITREGKRNFVHPADVRGRFTRLRYAVFAVLIAAFLSLPWIRIGGHPAMFLDVAKRRFYLFGATFNAQDFWLVFFLLSGAGFALMVITTVLGRIWCGYTCPQTVFLEGVYRRVERLLEGKREVRLRRNAGPWNFDKIWRKGSKHAVFLGVSFVIAHAFLAYFVSVPSLFQMLGRSPAVHPQAFAWAMGITGILYFNFAWFREQLCLIVCPYGRLQSVLTDDDTLVIGYDRKRGEPRGKAHDPQAGDCVDCKRCVAVCPTGIDIRNGLQIDCIGCAACVDACDEIMTKLDRPTGLIRYDSMNGLEGKPRRFLRPRLALYALLGVIGVVVAGFALGGRANYEANLLRLRGAPPFVVEDGLVRNSLELHVVNKRNEPTTFQIEPQPEGGLDYVIPMREVTLESLASKRVPVFVRLPADQPAKGLSARVSVTYEGNGAERKVVTAPFIAPE